MKRKLTHIQRQYIKYCSYMRKVKDEKKLRVIWRNLLILNTLVGRQR